MHPRKVQHSSDLAHAVIIRDDFIDAERIEKLPLVPLQPPHHRPPPQRIASQRRNHRSGRPSTTFATKSAHCCPCQCDSHVRSWRKRTFERRTAKAEFDPQETSAGSKSLNAAVSRGAEVCYAFDLKAAEARAVHRREFLTLLGGAAAALPVAARAAVTSVETTPPA